MADRSLARRALALTDLTDLGEAATEAGARRLCARATGGPVAVAAVCLWPRFVACARPLLAGTGVRIATVVNFPSGADAPEAVLAQTAAALADGADEIDLVMPWRRFLAGEAEPAGTLIAAVRAACGDKALKVILESGEYPDAGTVGAAARLAIAAGADFVKTSTGKSARSATPEAARAMLEAIRDSGRPVGLKPSGGIRTLADAALYLELADAIMGKGWTRPETFRFGASGLYDALIAALAGAEPDADGAS